MSCGVRSNSSLVIGYSNMSRLVESSFIIIFVCFRGMYFYVLLTVDVYYLPRPPSSLSIFNNYMRCSQRAFHNMLKTEFWQQRHGRGQNRSDTEQVKPYFDWQSVRDHFYFVEQCALNSYHLHPNTSHDRNSRQFIVGDFVAHFAGYKGDAKLELLRHYASLGF
jgi:hypothetical protein